MIELNEFNNKIIEWKYLNGELNGVGLEYCHNGISYIKTQYKNGKKLYFT